MKITQKEKDIRTLLKLTQSTDLSKKLIESVTAKMPIAKDLLNDIHKILLSDENMKELEDGVAAVYDNNFSQQEIKDILKFYKSKSGKALLSKSSKTTFESAELGKEWGNRMFEKNQENIIKVITEHVMKSEVASPEFTPAALLDDRTKKMYKYIESKGWDINNLTVDQTKDIYEWTKTQW
jgi:hypothetical protein